MRARVKPFLPAGLFRPAPRSLECRSASKTSALEWPEPGCRGREAPSFCLAAAFVLLAAAPAQPAAPEPAPEATRAMRPAA
jgi:hypothetical protein